MTPLRQRMLEDMQVRNLSPHTQRAYIENVARFARHFGRSPADLGPEEIRTYQVYLIGERTLAPSSVEIAVCALRFLYKVTLKKSWSFDDLIPAPKKPRRLPVVLSPDEVVRVLDCVTSPKHRAVLTTSYAAGLRISEAVHLRPTDLDSRRMVIRIEQGKGQRDRYVMLSPTLLAVLHTWGQQLQHHPHVHCVVTGGGLSRDGTRWIACRPGFFLPVRVLSRLFRRLFLQYLQQAFEAGRLRFVGSLEPLAEASTFVTHLARAREVEWVVYAKRPFAGPRQVLDYIGRYTHRVAISNNRLIDLTNDQVRFRWKNYRADSQVKTLTLAATEFIRRFLLHVLPSGFQRIRYYGLLGNRHRTQKLARCRQLLRMTSRPIPETSVSNTTDARDYRDRVEALTGVSLRICPICHEGQMVAWIIVHASRPPATVDTS